MWFGLLASLAVLAVEDARADTADTLPRHPLEIEALVDPDGVLARLKPALAEARSQGDAALVAQLELARANACRVIADWVCQEASGLAAVEAARPIGDRALEARGLINAARAASARQDYSRASERLGQALLASEALGSHLLQADVQLGYSSISYALAKFASSAGHASAGLESLAGIDAPDLSTRLLRNRARALARLGQIEPARRDLLAARGAAQRLNDPKLGAEVELETARLARQAGDPKGSQSAAQRALAIGAEITNTQIEGQAREALGYAALDQGRRELAIAELDRALDAFSLLALERDQLRVARALLQIRLGGDPTVRERELARRILAIEGELFDGERALAADDYAIRVSFLEQEADLASLRQEAELAGERAQRRDLEARVSTIALGVALAAIAALAALGIFLRRNNRRLREMAEATKAEAAARAITLARTSHEIRAPLAALLGFGERALRPGSDPNQLREALATMQQTGRHILGVINDVLDAAALDAGQMRVRLEPVDPRALARDALAMLAGEAEDKGLVLDYPVQYPLPARIAADAQRVRQILLNLLNNAIKFTEQGKIVLAMSVDDSRRWLRFEVRDSGIGISADQLSKLFQPFARIDSDHGRRVVGSGLGLYLSRELARQMNGEIEARSELGVGSTFCLRLPIPANAPWIDAATPESTQAAAPHPATPRTLLSGQVLLVEDDPLLATLTQLQLAEIGLRVTWVGDGLDAIVKVDERPFDVLLIDSQLPRLGGIETVGRLRQQGCLTPMIALTADASIETRQGFLAAGCDAVLTKPVDRRHLYACLAEQLAKGRAVGGG